MATLFLEANRIFGTAFRVKANGTAQAGSTVFLQVDGSVVSSAEVDALGQWRLDIFLTSGEYEVAVLEHNAAGEQLQASEPTSLSLQYAASRKLPTLNGFQNLVALSSPTSSSFSFINYNAGVGVFAREDVNNAFSVFAYPAGTQGATFTHFTTPSVSQFGKVLFSTTARLSPEDTDSRFDAYVFDPAAGTTSLVAVPQPPFHRYGTAPSTSVYDVESIGFDYTGQPLVLVNHWAPSIVRKGYTNPYGNEFLLVNPNQTTAPVGVVDWPRYSGSLLFTNFGIRTPSLDPSGRLLSVTQTVGPYDHVGLTIDLQSGAFVSVVDRSTTSFTFHLGSTSDNTARAFLEVPSWYGSENRVIESLSNTQLIHESGGGPPRVIDTGLIPFQELSGDGLFIYYQKLDAHDSGFFVFDTEAGTRTLIAPLDTHAFSSEEAVIAAFLDNGFPRSVAATSFFAGAGAEDFDSFAKNFCFVYPQTEKKNIPAVGGVFAGVPIGRVLDFWDTPQDAPVVIMHQNDLPAMVGGRHELYVFDYATGYRRIGTKVSQVADIDSTSVLTQGPDAAATGAGNDVVYAGAGDDAIESGSGDDLVFAGKGDDVLIGGSGEGDDFYSGGEGLDTLRYISAVRPITIDIRLGQALGDDIGRDTFADVEVFVAGKGADVVYAPPSGCQVDGYTGNDRLVGNAGVDVVFGGPGNDYIVGGGASDRLDGQKGDDVYVVAFGSEHTASEISDSAGTLDEVRFSSEVTGDTFRVFEGDRGIDLVSLVKGDGSTRDLSGSASTNVDASLGSNALTLYGNNGNNILQGTRFNDRLVAGAGNDQLVGGAGKDSLSGGDGDDILSGGSGNDLLDGGGGINWYVFNAALDPRTNVDLIGGSGSFRSGTDRIHLSRSVFRAIGQEVGPLSSDHFVTGTRAVDRSDRIIFNKKTGAVLYDADGTGSIAALRFVTLIGAPDLNAGDLWLT